MSLNHSYFNTLLDTPELDISASTLDDGGQENPSVQSHPGDIKRMIIMEVDEYAEFEAWLESGSVEIV